MTLTPKQLYQLLNGDVNRCYENFVTQYAGDTGSVVAGNVPGTPWLAGDSGFAAPMAVEALRLKAYVDAHGTAQAREPHMRDCFIKLRAMGRTPTAVVDTGIA